MATVTAATVRFVLGLHEASVVGTAGSGNAAAALLEIVVAPDGEFAP
jgi:hypothetical protein